MSTINLGNRSLYRDSWDLPYFIAEIGVNHEGNINNAKLMIEQAANNGADAVKFQSYKAEKLASKNSPAYWDTTEEPTRSQYELFKTHDKFGQDEYIELAKFTNEQGIDFLATPFDLEAVDFLEPWVPAYKVASADINNFPLLRYIASKEKPILLSTGASRISEIYRALEICETVGNKDIILLHCILNYPTPIANANLGMIKHMRDVFPNYIIGYSDHTLPEHATHILPTAWLLGAQVIEKHFTYDKTLQGNDHYHALDGSDLRFLIEWQNLLSRSFGNFTKHYLPEEKQSRLNARRSLVVNRRIQKGEKLQTDDIKIKRPGTGIPPEFFEQVNGARALRDIEADEVLTYDSVQLSNLNQSK